MEAQNNTIYCSYFDDDVVLSAERIVHIQEQHPDLLPQYRNFIDEVINNPDSIRRSQRMPNGYLFTKWCDDVQNGKYVIVVVIAEALRKWVITSYISRKFPKGDIVWTKD